MQQFKTILTEGFSDKGEKYKFMNHDIKLFFGDLNFRVGLTYEAVISTIDQMTHENFDDTLFVLLNNDQLNQLKLDYKWMYNFKEMPISFLPTFKFDSGTNDYDTSKKRRVPSWCDRILWHSDDSKETKDSHQFVQPILYERRETTYSDHRPVSAYFEIK